MAEDGHWTISLSSEIQTFENVGNLQDYLAISSPLTQPQPFSVFSSEIESTPLSVIAGHSGNDPRTVFIVHGRDTEAKRAVTDFVRALDLQPKEWEEIVHATGIATPYTGDVVSLAFESVNAVIVLLTPDDLAHLHMDLLDDDDHEWERTPTGQARPNVLFEAGIAFAKHPDRTVIVEIGKTRPFSDVAGRNTIRLTSASGPLLAFANRLETAGCPVNRAGTDWLEMAPRFGNLAALRRLPPSATTKLSGPVELPQGMVLPSTPSRAAPHITAQLLPNGDGYLLELRNTGGVNLHNIFVEIRPEATHWHLLTDVFDDYPIPLLEPREHVRFPVIVSWGAGAATRVSLHATTPDGEPYFSTANLSIYG